MCFAVLRVVLTALTTHTSGSSVDDLFTLPQGTLPRILGGFTVGGTIETAVVAQAAAEGLAIIGILAAFGAFNAVASHHELLGAAPRAFHEPGLIVTVALAFVPSTLAAVGAVREADRARSGGRVVRRGRLVRLAVPILESGMERAVNLAESMDARGFARLPATPMDRVAGWLGLGSLLALGATFVALVGRATVLAAVLGLAATAGLVVAIVLASSGERPTRYRPRRLKRLDWVIGAIAVRRAGRPRPDQQHRRSHPALVDGSAHVSPVLDLAGPLHRPARRPGGHPVTAAFTRAHRLIPGTRDR